MSLLALDCNVTAIFFYCCHDKDSRLPVDEALNRQIGSLVVTQNWLGYFFISVQPFSTNFDPEQCSLPRLRSSKKLLRLIGACGVSSFSSCVPSFSADLTSSSWPTEPRRSSWLKGTLKIDLFHTVVFDECHHVAKGRRCQQIWSKVRECRHWHCLVLLVNYH